MREVASSKQIIKGENRTNTLVPTTVEEFELWLAERPELTDKRFEFVDGQIIEKTGMKQEELFISTFLMRLFINTKAFQDGDTLHPEIDSYINKKKKRIADLAYFTEAQIEAARKGK